MKTRVSQPRFQGAPTSTNRKSAALKRAVLTTTLFVAALGAAPLAQAAPSWSGTYVYEEDGGRTVGGTAIFISHELRLWRTNGMWMGKLESNGYQTYINASVSGRARGNRFEVLFNSRAADTLSPRAKRSTCQTCQRTSASPRGARRRIFSR